MPKKMADLTGLDGMRQDRKLDEDTAPKAAGPVHFAPGALYGYCPKCGAPGIRRLDGKDTCQGGHHYPSMAATVRPMKQKG